MKTEAEMFRSACGGGGMRTKSPMHIPGHSTRRTNSPSAVKPAGSESESGRSRVQEQTARRPKRQKSRLNRRSLSP